jgi:hypothetical protein
MIRVRMLETRLGSEDGFTLRRYQAGEVYELPGLLALSFLRRGWAEEVPNPLTSPPP